MLLVVLDTVRADAFAPWAKGPVAMPEASAWFAARGVTFREAAAASPWTGPSVASVMTGLLPSRHGADRLAPDLQLVPSVTTIAEILVAQGWHAAAFAGGGWVSKPTGMLQGFHHMGVPFYLQTRGDEAVAATRKAREMGPWFVMLHTYEAHDPYLAQPLKPGERAPPPPPVDLAAVDREADADGGRSLARRFLLDAATRTAVFGTAFSSPRVMRAVRYFERGLKDDPHGPALVAEVRAAYEEGLRRVDRALAALLRQAEADGLLKDAVVILLSDHGEAFGEHGILHHGRWLHEVLVHVPLFVVAPGWPAGLVVDEPCSLLDVLPTVCDLAGLPQPHDTDGRSLAPLVRGAPGRPAPMEEIRNEEATGFPGDEHLAGLRGARWKWVRTTDAASGHASDQVWDLRRDPAEASPRSLSETPDIPASFLEAMRAVRGGPR